jgi:hypothetical protein
MDIDKSAILEILYKTLSQKQIETSIIYWDKKVIKKGDEIRIGPKAISMPFDGVMIFVDLAPQYNWAHPCLYLIVNVEDLHTDVIEASFPPYSDEFPETVIVVLRYGKKPPNDRYFQAFDE